jgi:hypothetical protein
MVIVTLHKGGSGNRNDGINKEIIVTLKMESKPERPTIRVDKQLL